MSHWLYEFLTKDRFDFLDLLTFYIIWTELIPWVGRKWKAWRGFSWKCKFCPKSIQFKVTTNDKKITTSVAENHLMQFHQTELIEKARKNEPVTDQ